MVVCQAYKIVFVLTAIDRRIERHTKAAIPVMIICSGKSFAICKWGVITIGTVLTVGSYFGTVNSSINGSENENYFVGLAYHHFNRPLNSFYKNPGIELNPKLVASAGARFTASENSYITIQADFSKQGEYKETIAGATYSIKIGDDYANPLYTLH